MYSIVPYAFITLTFLHLTEIEGSTLVENVTNLMKNLWVRGGIVFYKDAKSSS